MGRTNSLYQVVVKLEIFLTSFHKIARVFTCILTCLGVCTCKLVFSLYLKLLYVLKNLKDNIIKWQKMNLIFE